MEGDPPAAAATGSTPGGQARVPGKVCCAVAAGAGAAGAAGAEAAGAALAVTPENDTAGGWY